MQVAQLVSVTARGGGNVHIKGGHRVGRLGTRQQQTYINGWRLVGRGSRPAQGHFLADAGPSWLWMVSLGIRPTLWQCPEPGLSLGHARSGSSQQGGFREQRKRMWHRLRQGSPIWGWEHLPAHELMAAGAAAGEGKTGPALQVEGRADLECECPLPLLGGSRSKAGPAQFAWYGAIDFIQGRKLSRYQWKFKKVQMDKRK